MVRRFRIEAGGVSMRCAALGSGERPVVMLPGVSPFFVTESAEAVASVYGAMVDEFTIFLIDRRDDLPEDYPISLMAEETAQAIRGLGLGRVDIFGASQGGMMALHIAAEHQDAVRSIVLASGAARIYPAFRTRIHEWLALANAGDQSALAQKLARDMYSSASLESKGNLLIPPGYTDEQLRRFTVLTRSLLSLDAVGELDKISCPAFVISAKGDNVTTSAEIADRLHCETCYYGTEYGHAVYDEAPDFVSRVIGFLHKV